MFKKRVNYAPLATDFDPAREVLQKYRSSLSRVSGAEDLIPLLQALQQAYGYLPAPVLAWLSRKTGIPTARIHGVITFYAQFYTEPHGRHTIKCCQGTACHVKGSRRIGEIVQDLLEVEEGGTTKDMHFTYKTVACLGTCFLAPVMMIDNRYYGQLTREKISKILANYKG